MRSVCPAHTDYTHPLLTQPSFHPDTSPTIAEAFSPSLVRGFPISRLDDLEEVDTAGPFADFPQTPTQERSSCAVKDAKSRCRQNHLSHRRRGKGAI